jgi:hypothetical protein
MLDGKQRQNIKGDQKDNCEFNAGAKRIGQRFLIDPYFQQKKGAQTPESENSAPSDECLHFFIVSSRLKAGPACTTLDLFWP